MIRPPKSNIDTKNDGLEHVIFFKIWPFLDIYVRFQGGTIGHPSIHTQSSRRPMNFTKHSDGNLRNSQVLGVFGFLTTKNHKKHKKKTHKHVWWWVGPVSCFKNLFFWKCFPPSKKHVNLSADLKFLEIDTDTEFPPSIGTGGVWWKHHGSNTSELAKYWITISPVWQTPPQLLSMKYWLV